MIKRLVFPALLLIGSALSAQAPTTGNQAGREEVRRVAMDYLEGFYEGDTVKIVRAFRPDMYKYGFFKDSTGKYEGSQMTYAAAIAYAKRVKANNRPVNPAWPKQVEIYDVQDQTASGKVTAWWGTDYLLFAKYNGAWQITHVLWQGPPVR
jgi:hypothetical protein